MRGVAGHPEAGELLSHYRVTERLGAGGMGVVWRAEDLTLGRHVALKFLAETLEMAPEAAKRLEREARAAASLNHPGICTVYEVGEYRSRPFIAMELLEGRPLDAHLLGRPLDIRKLVDLATQIADGLTAAHAHDVVHRDIKPANVFITSAGTAKILDFGIARVAAEAGDATSPTVTAGHLTGTGATLGTPAYMSPEQARGEPIDARSDIFSLGAVLFEMATGKPPFGRSSAAVTFEAILNRQPPPVDQVNPAAPAELVRIVGKALEKDPALRYQSAADLVADLRRLRRDLDSGAMATPQAAGTPHHVSQTSSPRSTRRARLTGVAIGIAVLIGLVATLTWTRLNSPAAGPGNPITSILVLPLSNVASDPALDDLADGLTEALINRLSGVTSLRVLARNTSFRFKGTGADPTETARSLGVGAVMTGRVEQQAGMVRVGAELVDVSTGSQLWGSRYSRTGSEMMSIEEDISRAIAESLRVRLSPSESTSLARRPTDSVEAYRLYLAGRQHWNQRTAHDLVTAIDYFNRAIDGDPAFALAYSGIAESYVLLPANGISWLKPHDAMPKARAAAIKALELDAAIAEAHTALAYVHLNYDWDWEGAEREFARARTVRPNDATFWRGAFFAATGKADEAIAEAQRAEALDPLSGIVAAGLSWMFHLAGRFEDERREAQKALGLNSRLAMAHMRLGWALSGLGQNAEAIASQQSAVTHSGGSTDMLGALGYALARAGRHQDARDVLDRMRTASAQQYVSALSIALVHTALGNRDQALTALEAAHEERSWGMAFIGADPAFDSLREEPRFAELIRRMRIPQESR